MEPRKSNNRRTALYRHFDGLGRLLYVGISINPAERLDAHARRSPWAFEIRTVTIEWFDDKWDARDAEKAAIIKESPIHNIDHTPMAERARAERVRIEQVKRRLEAEAEAAAYRLAKEMRKERRRRGREISLDDLRAAIDSIGSKPKPKPVEVAPE